MKIIPYIVASVIAGVSFSSLAASREIDQQQALAHQSIGVVSVYDISGPLDHADHVLEKKANADHAPYYRVIGLSSSGDSGNYSGEAQLYR
ncbi:YdgH/BhsA/McbA-like domain containing protein [Acerihabitans sp. TG2]|uniref:YdgH/BhsA/McbA-like domain containing protein n=1 Tax=Acerihabitans sp. TG2 TaxID=3096008 RepID=UPI002B226950|nr:YdgH/BhsA/McbA-like domain containing protein [Acerihabitans sp. TG2]MEA9392018.1 YdgH/BhsA/McbA-like domain containing protein [Acerihabitans sp. TG2]